METSESTEQKTVSLRSELETLFLNQTEPDDEYTYTGVYSNDLFVAEQIPSLQRDLKAQYSSANIKVGLVIGSGGILSLGKELSQIDLWVVLDKSHGRIERIKQYCEMVSEARDPEHLIELSDKYGPQQSLSEERKSYGQYHYLTGDDNLQKTQQFLREKKIVFMNADLLDTDTMGKIGNILRAYKAEISFANFTNVMEWMPHYNDRKSKEDLQPTLDIVPFSRDCVCLFTISGGGGSIRWKVGRSPLIASTVVGINKYLEVTNV